MRTLLRRRAGLRLAAVTALVAGFLATGCDSSPSRNGGGSAGAGGSGGSGGNGGSGGDGGDGFDDHTLPRLADRAAYDGFAADGPGLRTVKFVITGFGDPAARALRWFDGHAYTLHDEWYWFRLLNGAAVPGETVAPVVGLSFATVPEIYEWARQQPALPLDLRWVGPGDERLYSPRFYELALSQRPRALGLGGLIHIPERLDPPLPEIWAFELEYSDLVTHEELVLFFEAVESTVPAEVAPQVKWVVRSPTQETLARRMEQERLPYHDRILRYRELAVPGEVEVYGSGLTAGRVKIVRAGEELLADARETDLLFLEEIPDQLPPCAGLVSAVPQTALAHIAVLARNRGIPNAYLGGLLDNPELDQLDRVRAPVVVRAVFPDRLEIVPITEAQYAFYQQLGRKSPLAVEPIDLGPVPLSYDLATLTLADVEPLRPVIGGKAAGFLGLLAPGTVTHPDRPLVITVKPYVAHVAPLVPGLTSMLQEPDFQRSALVRYLVIEGVTVFDRDHPGATEQAVKTGFLATHPPGNAAGDLARGGGIGAQIRALPLAPVTLAELTAVLQAQFGAYSPLQGLRFRSSSNLEDIEGFNGAGLYDSNTGYLDASVQPTAQQQARTVEWAIKKTWASYWTFEAFEERRLELVDHLSGAMAVVVHATFNDDKELSNGVLTFTHLPAGGEVVAVMELDVQDGVVSVTNPEPGSTALPEIDVLTLLAGEAEPRIERRRQSNLVAAGVSIYDDAELRSIFAQAEAVEALWRAHVNSGVPPSRQTRTLTLDIELREVDVGWPALASGEPFPRRIVLKQSRTLEPSLRGVPDSLRGLPLPRDVLARARRIEQRRCVAEAFTAFVVEAYTDPLRPPDLGHDVLPFTGVVSLSYTAAVPALGLDAGGQSLVFHPELTLTEHPGLATGGPWALSVEVEEATAAREGVDRITLGADGAWELARAGVVAQGSYTPCEVTVLLATPEDYLLSLLTARGE